MESELREETRRQPRRGNITYESLATSIISHRCNVICGHLLTGLEHTQEMKSKPFVVATLLPLISAETTISQSHIFHSAPRPIISSILSHVSSSLHNDRGIDALTIDVSSSRLDDESISLLIDKLLMQLDENRPGECDERIGIKMDLSMNKLTPSGIAKFFDKLLIYRVNNPKTDEKIKEFAVTAINGSNAESTKNEDAFNLTQIDSVDIANETTTSQWLGLKKEKQQPIELDELDLSFNDIGGHGSSPANLALLTSVRRLFEHGQSNLIVPKVLSLENCGVGPAFCRSIGRVSILKPHF